MDVLYAVLNPEIQLELKGATKMAKNKVLTEKTDINTPFSEFVRKFKNRKCFMVAMVFLVFLVVLAFYQL